MRLTAATASVAAIAALAVSVVIIVFGAAALPSRRRVLDAGVGDMVGVWFLTWSLIGLGAFTAVVVAVLAVSDAARARAGRRA